MNACINEKKNPIHIVRYEDLCDAPMPELTSMMKFCLDLNDLTGTNMERRIKTMSGEGPVETYKLKKET